MEKERPKLWASSRENYTLPGYLWLFGLNFFKSPERGENKKKKKKKKKRIKK